jgi:hypothetical protein
MPLVLYILFFFSTMQSVTIICSERTNGLEDFKVAQPDSSLIQLPQPAIDRIIACLPLFYAQDRACLRATCRFFREKIFLSPKIRLGLVPYEKEQYDLWEKVYAQLARYMQLVAGCSTGSISLNLSGNKVTEFMIGKYQVCQHIKRLKLINCNITMERDSFFDKEIWPNLEEIDLSDNFLALRDGDLSKSGEWYSGANIWPALCSLPKLKILILRYNRLSRLPQDIYKATQLEILDLRENMLRDEDVESLKLALPHTRILVNYTQKLQSKPIDVIA